MICRKANVDRGDTIEETCMIQKPRDSTRDVSIDKEIPLEIWIFTATDSTATGNSNEDQRKG